jgi:hypothetical protein
MLEGRANDRLIETLRAREDRLNTDFWSFRKPELRRGAHALIHYPAMMVPSLQGLIMNCAQASQPTMQSVFDPFAGSGTVLVEAMEHGLNFSGVDINPLAGLACLAKGGPYYVDSFDEKVASLLGAIRADRRRRKPRNFGGRTKWFSTDAACNLEKLHHHILREPSRWARRLFWLALCRVVRVACNSRMSTYKLHVKADGTKSSAVDVCTEFVSVVGKFQLHLREQHESLTKKGLIDKGRYVGSIDVNVADARTFLKGERRKYDLVMTSPPYGDNVTTIPYGQFSYLPLQWIDVADIAEGVDLALIQNTHATDTASLGGTLRGALEKAAYIAESYSSASQFLKKVRNGNGKKRFGAFFFDLDKSIERIASATRNDGLHAWTIANRRICGLEVPMVPLLTEMLEARGVRPIGTIARDIHFKKMAVKNAIAPTMTAETILLGRKSGSRHAEQH